jgi:hypothetical protein
MEKSFFEPQKQALKGERPGKFANTLLDVIPFLS